MGYAGRHNIYDAVIRKMVDQALEQQERQFRSDHETDTDAQLLWYLKQESARMGHTPWPGEVTGGTYIESRFGTWNQALYLAKLPEPNTPNKQSTFARVQAETEKQKALYRQKKAEKKLLSEQRARIQNEKKLKK